MPGPLAHVGAVVTCFHQGAVTVAPSFPGVLLSGSPAITVPDQLAVAGCPFQIPFGAGTKPQPCVLVRLEPSKQVVINGKPALLVSPAALCYSVEQIPQGVPNMAAVQKKVIAK